MSQQGFKRLMNMDCKDLQKFGFKAFEQKECEQTFLTKQVCLKVNSIADDYWFRLLARAKSIAVSVGDLPRLPWEQVLFGSDTIASLPSTTKVPFELLSDNKNAREACIDLLPKDMQLTFAEMETQLKKHESVLLSLCKDFSQEVAFLTQRAEEVAQGRFKADLMEQMPTTSEKVATVEGVLDYLRKARLGTLFRVHGWQVQGRGRHPGYLLEHGQ